MIKEEWKRDYLLKSGDEYIVLGDECVVNEYGFCTYGRHDLEDVLIVYNCYGDGGYWEEFLKNKARELGCKKIRFATKRNPKAFERRFGAKVVGYIMEVEV